MATLIVNGQRQELDVDPNQPLAVASPSVALAPSMLMVCQYGLVRHRSRSLMVNRSRRLKASPVLTEHCTRCNKLGSTIRCLSAGTASPAKSCRRLRCSKRRLVQPMKISTVPCGEISAGAGCMAVSARQSSKPR